jgi:adenosylcobinamide kinase/adenosylcobinamide-phosphate guanylyltransferase
MKQGKFILITGGARSGKSSFAEKLATQLGEKVIYVATAMVSDPEMEQRVAKHRQRRPASWQTVEEPFRVAEIIEKMGQRAQVLLVDCLTILLSNLIFEHASYPESDQVDYAIAPERQQKVLDYMKTLAHQASQSPAHVIIVSNEVGQGMVPAFQLGRMYRDVAGWANQIMAAQADTVYLVVAGIPVPIKQA